jgi:Transglutaminase-like superfamily
LKEMVRAVHGVRGEQSILVRSVTEEVVSGLQPKDYLGEILAIRYWVTENVRYVNDPLHVEVVKDPERIVEEIMGRGQAAEDCDGIALLIATMCLQVGRAAEFVVAGFGEPGHYSHVFVRVKEPRTNQWIVCDPVAGSDERGMLDRVTTFYTKSLDEAA